MFKNIIFYFLGGLFSIVLIAYGVFFTTFLISQTNKAYQPEFLKVPAIATLDFEKINELKINK